MIGQGIDIRLQLTQQRRIGRELCEDKSGVMIEGWLPPGTYRGCRVWPRLFVQNHR